MKKFVIAIGLVLISAGPVRALQGVGALADQLATGKTVHIVGKTAPFAEVNVVAKSDDHIVATAEIERTGDFDFQFKLRAEDGELQIFAGDDFGLTSRLELSLNTGTVLLPPTIVNDVVDTSTTAVALTGRTYPNAEVTISLSPESKSYKASADEKGLWRWTNNDLKAGKYTVTAASKVEALISQPSQEIFFEIQPLNVPMISKLPQIGFGVWWWLIVILLAVVGLWPIDVWILILRLIYGFLYLLGFYKQRRKWGVVYDSVSKKPIAGAIVRLYGVVDGRSQMLEMVITDKGGEFAFLPRTGRYLIKVVKGGYVFPSVLVKKGSDGEYINVYHGEEFEVAGGEEVMVSVAMDRIKYRVGLWYSLSKYLGFAWRSLGWCLLIFGVVFSIRIWLSTASTFDGVVMVAYVGLLIFNLGNGVRAFRGTSRVVAADGRGVASASIAVYEATSGILFQRRVSDEKGRFILRLPKGGYRIIYSAVDHVADEESTVNVPKEGVQNVKVSLKMRRK